ncbi:unnamed protein product [Pocillopora meandrina]|uniref:Uncharacterized protein n=1 Tax=Pocillopora meandrina TaxID=46732 RepID=A0AAU9VN71_9CNID|nr:unnamed protein product [Pocillopora meandrina]
MGSALLKKGLWVLIFCILNAELNASQDLEGIFQDYGSKETQPFPVYHTVKGFDIQLRFSTETCTGQLVEIKSKDTNHFLRLTLLDIGPIRMSYSTPKGKSQLNLAMPLKGGFCDGKRHSLWLSTYRGVVSFGVDKAPPIRFYVALLRELFPSPANIIIGKGLQGCVSGSTVVLRVSKTQEYRVGTSSGCSMNKPTTQSPKQILAQVLENSDKVIKVTTKRTTLIRGTLTKNEQMWMTNSLKKVTTRNPILPRKAEESTTEATSLKKDARYTTENQGKATIVESSSALTTEIDSRVSTTATGSTTRQTTSLLSSMMTGTLSTVIGKEKLEKRLSTAGSLVDNKSSKRNETKNGRDTVPTNTVSPRWNISTPVMSTTKPDVCGGVLMSVKGQLMSPGYPKGYPSNTTCIWSIILPSDYHLISFTFHKVYLEEDRNCVYDYIAVCDMLGNEVGQRYCGSITSPILKHVKGNMATVVFRSDSANSKKGFILSYKGRKCHNPSVVDE